MDGTRFGFATSRTLLLACAILVMLQAGVATAAKLRINNRYSPRNSERTVRSRTDYIILHTTEGSDRPSLDRIRRGGLAHYVVMRNGQVYRIISRNREARHAGRSMWDGVKNIDDVSVGIEVVGYHNQDLTSRQLDALAELVRQLQSVYKIPDDQVLTHSMVAYGRPNRWHKHSHRGRKRCGMVFMRPEVRTRLKLTDRPQADPDVAAGRLIIGDPYLATVLFGGQVDEVRVAEAELGGSDTNVITANRTAWFIARDKYDDATTMYVYPSGKRKRGDQITDWAHMPRGTMVLMGQQKVATTKAVPALPPAYRVVGRDGSTASEVAGKSYRGRRTFYVRTNGSVKRGDQMSDRDFRRLAKGTRVFVGYKLAGTVSRSKTAYDLCGVSFRKPSTVYVMPGGRVKTGVQIREKSIPSGTVVLMKS